MAPSGFIDEPGSISVKWRMMARTRYLNVDAARHTSGMPKRFASAAKLLATFRLHQRIGTLSVDYARRTQ